VSDESNVSRLVEKVSISNDELGKRKLQNDLELDERRQTLAETTSNALKTTSNALKIESLPSSNALKQ